MNWTCKRCAAPMYSVIGPNGAKATCSSCSQYVDCAKCSNQLCGDTKCVPCFNKSLTAQNRPAGGPLVPQDEEIG